MSEETKTYSEEEVTQAKANAVAEATKGLFNQEKVNDIIAKERKTIESKFADYDTLKEQAGQTADLIKKTQTSEEAIGELLATIPEDKKSLIPDDYDSFSKLKWFSKNKEKLFIVPQTETKTEIQTIQTPSPEPETKKENSELFGGYKTANEQALYDPIGYGKANPEKSSRF